MDSCGWSMSSSPETLCCHLILDLLAYIRTVEVEDSVRPSPLVKLSSLGSLSISNSGRTFFEVRPVLKRSRRCLFDDDLEGQETTNSDKDKDDMNTALERARALLTLRLCHLPSESLALRHSF